MKESRGIVLRIDLAGFLFGLADCPPQFSIQDPLQRIGNMHDAPNIEGGDQRKGERPDQQENGHELRSAAMFAIAIARE